MDRRCFGRSSTKAATRVATSETEMQSELHLSWSGTGSKSGNLACLGINGCPRRVDLNRCWCFPVLYVKDIEELEVKLNFLAFPNRKFFGKREVRVEYGRSPVYIAAQVPKGANRLGEGARVEVVCCISNRNRSTSALCGSRVALRIRICGHRTSHKWIGYY